MSLGISVTRPAAKAMAAGSLLWARLLKTWTARRALMLGLLLPFLADSVWLLADRRGLFGAGVGVAIRELCIIAALLGFLLLNTRILRQIDLEWRRTTDSLKVAQDSLQFWVEEQARIDEELRDSDRRYRFLADAMPQIVWTARPDGNTEYTNRRWSDYTGQPLEESSQWGWASAIHPVDLDLCSARWTVALESGERHEIEYRIRRFDGEYRWHLCRADPMRDETGAIVRWFGTCTDIDDQKRVEAELRSSQDGLSDRVSERTAELEAANHALVLEVAERKLAEEAAQSASRAKGEFLANMSHEIRTPMNGILGMTELALGTSLSATQREYLGLVVSSADSLLTVINDILDFSKIEAGKLDLDPVPFSLRDAVTDTLRSLSLRAHDKGLELLCRIAPDVPRSVIGDLGRLRQILFNLVGNAIKFTEVGEVVVAVSVVAEKEPGDTLDSTRLRVSVSDTGIGIPVDKRASIFAAFEQADGSTTRKYGGTGLGLAISSKLVALMGGTIVVEEVPGGGSLFRFEVRLGGEIDRRGDDPSANPVALEGLRVLMVDDNQTNRWIMEELLTQWGCRPLAVSAGAEALSEISEALDRGEPYAVVIVDRLMPGMDGLELAGRLRAWESAASGGGPHLKILMLTSGGFDQPDRPELKQLDGWLNKPVRQSELLNRLVDLLVPPQLACDPPGGANDPIGPGEKTHGCPSTVTQRLQILLAEDHPINQRVATRMLEDLGHRVTVAGNGRIAVEAAASGDFDLVLMDVQMPEMDGFEALAATRRQEATKTEAAIDRGESAPPHLPIIALTAHAMSGDRERCLNAGFDDYLSKPVHAAKLRDILARFFPDLPPVAGLQPQADRPESPRFNRRAALEAMGDDEALLDEVIRLFLDETPRLLDQIDEATDLEDHATLTHLAHTLAGVASNFGPNIVTVAARRVEELAKAGAGQSVCKAAIDHLDLAFEQFQAVLPVRVDA